MKHVQKMIIILITVVFCSSLMLIKNIGAECTKENKAHSDQNVVCCPYSQEDLTRMHQKNPDRVPCENMCCYCGCQKECHTQK